MAQFPTTAEELNEQIAQFKRRFTSVDEEKRFYQSVLRRFDAKHQLYGRDIYMFDIPMMASQSQSNNWLKLTDLICQQFDNYLDLYPRLKTYILDHAINLDDLFKSYKLFGNDARYAAIVANKTNSYNTCIRYAEFQHISAEIQQIFENRAIAIMRQNPNERRNVPITLPNLSIAALSTHAYDPQPVQIQEQKQRPTLNAVQMELKEYINISTAETRAMLQRISDDLNEAINANHEQILGGIMEISRKQNLRWWHLKWWTG